MEQIVHSMRNRKTNATFNGGVALESEMRG